MGQNEAFEPTYLLYLCVFLIFYMACWIFKRLNLSLHNKHRDLKDTNRRYKWLSLPHHGRYQQMVTPLLAVVYIILVLTYINDINTACDNFLAGIAGFCNSHFPAISNYVAGKWDLLRLAIAKSFGGKEALAYLKLSFRNFIFVVAYALIKYIILLISNGRSVLNNEFWYQLYEFFYEADEDSGDWYLLRQRVQMRDMYKILYCVASILLSFLFILNIKYRGTDWFSNRISPAFVILVFGDIVFFLDGWSKDEWLEFIGSDLQSHKIQNYSLMLDQLRQLFGDRLAHSELKDNSALVSSNKTRVIRELIDSKDHDENLVGEYFQVYMDNGGEVDVDYMKSTLSLLKGNSVLFQTPFYKDLTPYAFVPMNRQLMYRNKALVIVGRNNIEEDIAEWVRNGLSKVNHIPYLWEVSIIDKTSVFSDTADVQVVSMAELYDIKMLGQHKEFMDKVTFVLFVEPSKLLTTCQIGLAMFASIFKDRQPVYCICDRNCDGLVDALSHVLSTNLVTVSATNVTDNICSHMNWKVDGKPVHHRLYSGIAHYLGFGTELGTLSVKDGVSKVNWYSDEKFPVSDMHWIAGQYIETLCQFMGIPVDQYAMDEHLEFVPNFWSAAVTDNKCIVAEDEFNNLFEVRRQFATRASEQNFVNILSSNYLLRDYMADNPNIFYKDSKAIPSIVADEVKTERNVLLTLLLELQHAPRDVEDIIHQFEYSTITYNKPDKDSTKKQIAEHAVTDLIKKYFPNVNTEDIFVSTQKREFDVYSNTVIRTFLQLRSDPALENVLAELSNAYYIPEDGETNHYLGAKLLGHVYQSFLPGQFITLAGKYYEVLSITSEHGVVMRRAADHIKDRRYYRQLRKYTLSDWKPDSENIHIGREERTFGNIIVQSGSAAIRVETDGYLELTNYNDLVNAVKVSMKQRIPDRTYVNKTVLRIELKEASREVLLTIAILLNELFRTVYPNASEYITALCSWTKNLELDEGMIYDLTIQKKDEETGEIREEQDNYIYIIEDSQLDIGLQVSFERYLRRFLEIICDYLVWHRSLLSAPKVRSKDEDPIQYNIPSDDRNIFKRAWDSVKESLWNKKVQLKKADIAEKTVTANTEDANPEAKNVDEQNVGTDLSVNEVTVVDKEITKGAADIAAADKLYGDTDTTNIDEGKQIAEDSLLVDTTENDSVIAGENGCAAEKMPTIEAAKEPDSTDTTDDDKAAETEETNSEQTLSKEQTSDSYNLKSVNADVIEQTEDTVKTDEAQTEKGVVFADADSKQNLDTAADADNITAQIIADEDIVDTGEYLNSESTVWTTKYGECYHLQNCRSLKDSDKLTETTVAEARLNGYRACELCIKLSEEERKQLLGDMETLLGEYGLELTDDEKLQLMRDVSGNDKLMSADELTPDEIEWINNQAKHRIDHYMETYYLLYGKQGKQDINSNIKTADTVGYLSENRFGVNSLRHAREDEPLAVEYEAIAEGKKRYVCDFCGKELTGVEYERLYDGRIRCNLCAESGITKADDIEHLFVCVLRNMEAIYNISLKSKIKVVFADSKTIALNCNSKYIPTPKGYKEMYVALKGEGDCNVILIQSGIPRVSAIAYLAYALTLVWEHNNWDKRVIRKTYGRFSQREVYHGMGVWAAIQYLIFIGEKKFASRLIVKITSENGIYGRGLCRFINQYPFVMEQSELYNSPFHTEHPLSKSMEGKK